MGLGLFLLAQCFTLPLAAVGPSWTLWPTLPDMVLWATGLCAAFYSKPVSSAPQRQLWHGLLYLFGMSVSAFAVLFIYNDPLLATELRFGAFAIYRLLQVLLAFWVASRLDYTQALFARWRIWATVAFCVTCGGVIITAFSGVPIKFLSQHLPHGLGVSGPWESYYLYQDTGLGFVGFNHGYIPLQVMLLGALVIYLNEQLGRRGGEWVLGLALAASFLSNARSGLIACLVFAALQLLRAPLRAAFAGGGVGAVGLLLWLWLKPDLTSTAARQATIFDATDSTNLAGRTDIWQSIFTELLREPVRLLIGSGLGSTVINKGNNAHNMMLQILFETGIAGLVNVGGFFTLLLVLLVRAGPQAQVIVNVTAGFLVSSLTQETFFPNVAFGSFLPLYALVVAVVLARKPQMGKNDSRTPVFIRKGEL